jgi:hypothetical protein
MDQGTVGGRRLRACRSSVVKLIGWMLSPMEGRRGRDTLAPYIVGDPLPRFLFQQASRSLQVHTIPRQSDRYLLHSRRSEIRDTLPTVQTHLKPTPCATSCNLGISSPSNTPCCFARRDGKRVPPRRKWVRLQKTPWLCHSTFGAFQEGDSQIPPDHVALPRCLFLCYTSTPTPLCIVVYFLCFTSITTPHALQVPLKILQKSSSLTCRTIMPSGKR